MAPGENLPKRVRIMFLAWGESIHARRRIRIFTEDPFFEVAVVSTFNYNFENAQNCLLTDAQNKKLIFFKILKWITRRNTLALLLEDIWRGCKDLRILKKAVSAFHPDVIFLQTLLYPCYLAYFLPKKIPVVITFWNGDVTWWAKWTGVERLLKKKIVMYGVQHATALTVNSKIAFDACTDYGAPPEKIHLIRYPGVDLERFRPSEKNKARQKINVAYRHVVLCPRGLGGYLNSDIIINAAATVIKKIPEVMFLFISGVGGEEEWRRHLKWARELGIPNNLRRDGQIPWDKVPLYYQAADVVVSVSSNDSLPNCMMEAMACGIPVVMGDIPQIREWVTDGVNGLLVPPRDPEALSDALIKILDGSGKLTTAFVRYNLDLVRREFDSRKNTNMIKQLVVKVTKKHLS